MPHTVSCCVVPEVRFVNGAAHHVVVPEARFAHGAAHHVVVPEARFAHGAAHHVVVPALAQLSIVFVYLVRGRVELLQP